MYVWIVGDFSEIAGATRAERTDARMQQAPLSQSRHLIVRPPALSLRTSDFGEIADNVAARLIKVRNRHSMHDRGGFLPI